MPTSSTPSAPFESPAWFKAMFGLGRTRDGDRMTLRGQEFEMRHGIPRSRKLLSKNQDQTAGAFGFKWHQRQTFEGEALTRQFEDWLDAKYGPVKPDGWFAEHGPKPLVLDAGCGAAMGGLALLRHVLRECRYLGVDVSTAVDVAAQRFAERGLEAGFLQTDLMATPLSEGSVDIAFSEGVLHHTDSTEAALKAIARLLKPGGRFLFYVYRRKGPVREFTDDHIRDKLHHLEPEQAWEALKPLTALGKALGELGVTIDVPQAIDLLEIPAGKIDLQRFFYWHIAKAFYGPHLTFDEMHHLNFDWYAPKSAHRQTPEQVRAWCREAGLEIEHEKIEEPGITVIARRLN
jgi:SAM-dependent methyltransferase